MAIFPDGVAYVVTRKSSVDLLPTLIQMYIVNTGASYGDGQARNDGQAAFDALVAAHAGLLDQEYRLLRAAELAHEFREGLL